MATNSSREQEDVPAWKAGDDRCATHCLYRRCLLQSASISKIKNGNSLPLSKKIYQSYEQFRATIMDWSDIAERAFLDSRRLA
jgi:hypothetical protein